MELEVWFTAKKGYRFTKIDLPTNVDKDFYEKLRLRLFAETEEIKSEIKKVANKYNTSFSKPKIDDPKEKIRTNKLIKARKQNLVAMEKLDNLLRNDDCIICEHCKNLMYKCPINIPYEKVGTGYLLLSNSSITIEYIYNCSNPDCIFAVDEKTYQSIQNNLKRRRELLEMGKGFVPNKYGFWHWEKYPNKEEKENDDCDHCWIREFESIKVKTQDKPIMKIQERCVRCNKTISIR